MRGCVESYFVRSALLSSRTDCLSLADACIPYGGAHRNGRDGLVPLNASGHGTSTALPQKGKWQALWLKEEFPVEYCGEASEEVSYGQSIPFAVAIIGLCP